MVGRPRKFCRDEALDKAMALFWEQGFEATGVAQLTETLGIGRQSLYGAFGDKRGLYLEALKRYSDESLGGIRKQLNGPGRAIDGLHAFLDGLAERAGSPGYSGCFLTNSCSELGARDPDLTIVLQHNLTRLADLFQGAIERAQAEGDISADTNPRALARALVNTLQGLATASKVEPGFARDTIDQVRRLLA
jgi:TetR/AcrR family transcriptional repressor of nem operon